MKNNETNNRQSIKDFLNGLYIPLQPEPNNLLNQIGNTFTPIPKDPMQRPETPLKALTSITSAQEKQNNMSQLYEYAQQVKKDIDNSKYDAVTGLEKVSSLATLLSGNQSKDYVDYMTSVFVGKGSTDYIKSPGSNPPIYFGDSGFNTDYRDFSPQQSLHAIGFLNVGMQGGDNLISWGKNLWHETVHPIRDALYKKPVKGSMQDYNLSKVMIKAGEKLRTGKWSPVEFTSNIQAIFRNKSLEQPPGYDLFANIAIWTANKVVDV